MIKRLLIGLLTLFALTFYSYGQNKPKSKRNLTNETQAQNLVGTWRLIEFTNIDTLTGKKEYPYGEHPKDGRRSIVSFGRANGRRHSFAWNLCFQQHFPRECRETRLC